MSHFSQVLRYANLAAFPAIGDTSIVYIANDIYLIYVWDGAAYQSAGGSDDPIIDGEVNTYGELPAAATHSGETYLVKIYSILYPTKLSGLYYSDGASWARRSDKVLYSITAFSAVNKLIKTADTDRQTIETGITIDSSENITGVNNLTIGGNFTGSLSGGTALPDGGLTLTDVTTNNASTTKHGFLPKLSNVATEFLNGQGSYVPITIQNTYDNSTSPEILTDSTRGALTVRRGSAADTDNIYEGQNNAGTTTFSVNGNGLVNSSYLTVSQLVVTDASKNLTSLAYASANTASAVVQRNASGNFTAGTITAALTGNASTATTLATGRTIAITGDLAYTSPTFNGSGNVTAAGTLATVNANVGSFGSATAAGTFTVNAKGLITAASNTTVTPAVGSITGLGTGVATALAVNVGTAGSPVVNGGVLGTPSSGVATNLTGTASGLTAGNVTTNANLTGDVTSVGNATTLTNAPVIAKVLTGYVSGAGTVAATDSILQAIQKLNGNDATNANLTGAVTSVGNATSLGSFTSAQLLAAVTDETGTGVAVFGTAPTISLPVINNVKFGYTTTETAAGTTTLTSASNLQQYFTGVTTQTVVLPVTSTLTLGQYYVIINNSTGNVTVQSSGANNILVMPAGTQAVFTVILTSGTTAASWSARYNGFTSITGTGANVLGTSPTLVTPLLGTPTSGTLTSCTGLPISTGVSGLGTGVATFLATPSSANLASAVTDETGTSGLVFQDSPIFTTQITSPTAVFTGASNTNKEYTANSGASITLDPANGLYQTITLTANTTITLTTVPSSTTAREIKLRLVQDGTGGRTVAWSNITFATGSVPVVPTAANSSTYISIDGTNNAWIGFSGSNYSVTSEIVIASAVSLTTTGVTTTITSLTVPAGRWRLSGGIGFIAAGTTTISKLVASISTVNNTLPTAPAKGAYNSQQLTYATGSTNNLPTGVTSPLDISVATTYYLVGQATFATSTMTAYGFLTAEALS